MGMFYPQVMAILVALGEFFGGLFLVIGLFSREASVVIIIIMIGAIVTVHWKNGFFLSQQGFEYNFAPDWALCILFGGAGILSLDSILFPWVKMAFCQRPFPLVNLLWNKVPKITLAAETFLIYQSISGFHLINHSRNVGWQGWNEDIPPLPPTSLIRYSSIYQTC